jgi:hypothetical protein
MNGRLGSQPIGKGAGSAVGEEKDSAADEDGGDPAAAVCVLMQEELLRDSYSVPSSIQMLWKELTKRQAQFAMSLLLLC